LSAALREAHAAWREGERRAEPIEARMRRTLESFPQANVEYIAIADPATLAPVAAVEPETVVAIAARVGSTRLIDNITLAEGIE
jgi:pantothenate synthetase